MSTKVIQLTEPIYKKPVVAQDTAPEDTNVLWVDTTDSDFDGLELFPDDGIAGQILTKTDNGQEWADPAPTITVDSELSSTSANPVENKVVNSAISNLNTQIAKIPQSIFFAGTSAPSDTKLLWIDTTATTGGLKYYNGSEWVHVPVAYT